MTHTKTIIAGDLLPMPCNYELFSSKDIQALLGMQMFMRNEEFNEVGNQILSDLLNKTNTKENLS